MKKFMLGLLCGMALFAATAAAASNEIKALLSPVYVNYYVNGETSQLSSDNTQILKYQDRYYVPLRAFSENMGAAVYYHHPLPNETASVDIYYVDDRDMTLKDKGGYVSMGHLDVQFSPPSDSPYISGTIKYNKMIPKDNDIVIALLDKDGKQVGVTEAIKLNGYEATSMGKDDISSFKTYFPVMTPMEDYQLQIQLVKKTAWSYKQIYGVIEGAGGVQGYPLAMTIGSSHMNKKGASIALQLDLINLSTSGPVEIKKPIAFEVEIFQYVKDTKRTIRTFKTEPFSGTIPWKQGGYQTNLVWDQKDSSGTAVPSGEYFASIKLPVTIAEGFTLETSMRTQFPIVIE